MARVVLNDAALHRLFASPAGPVAKDLARRAIRVETAAKQNASGRPGPRVQTGRLRASIGWRLVSDASGVYAEIGTNVSYAGYVEFGTRPHLIRPRSKRALSWKGAAHPVAYVVHPGNKPYPFLRPALSAAHG